VRASRLYVVARGWLEMKGLDHLLPDPHSHGDIQGCIATYYPGGSQQFLTDVDQFDFDESPTWCSPPMALITRVCENPSCGEEFGTDKAYKRYCSEKCRRAVERERGRRFRQLELDVPEIGVIVNA
jgi:hypothetical protein